MLTILVWSGHGYVVALVTFGSCLVAEYLTERVMDDDRYYQTHGWPKLVAFSVAALLTGLIARSLDRYGRRRLIDPETGAEVLIRGGDAFFWIPIRYWSVLLVLIGAALGFVREPN